jgi:hypothetical protein
MTTMGEFVYSPAISLARLSEIESVLGGAIRGKAEALRLPVACLLPRGHLLSNPFFDREPRLDVLCG